MFDHEKGRLKTSFASFQTTFSILAPIFIRRNCLQYENAPVYQAFSRQKGNHASYIKMDRRNVLCRHDRKRTQRRHGRRGGGRAGETRP
ncbi:hypothetical protein [Neisseria sicca]|uniref:hypothetical protein n=1 Tax=Neisseria sicca TaxID=490 RepID=UPI0011BD1D87|nr:hypothetical protein [Neisseria sicca]